MADPITITCPHCETGIRYGYCLCRRCAQFVHIRCAAQCGAQHKIRPAENRLTALPDTAV